MRAIPSFTSSTVPTSRTSISARSAVWISLRRISFSSPGRRMESVAMGAPLGDCEKYQIDAECEMGNAEFQWDVARRGTPGLPFRIPNSAFRIQVLERVLPLRNRVSPPRAPASRSSCGVAPATRRAAPARWLGDAYPRMRTTWRTLYPGLPSRSAAHAVRARSITRFRFGAPPAANSRDRCSRVTRSAWATWAVCVGTPTRRNTSSHAASCRRSVRRSSLRASASAAPRAADGTPGRRPSLRPLPALGRERLHHLGRPLQHPACVVIGDPPPRLLQRIPGALRDPFFRLRHRLAAARLEQKEVTVLVDRLATEPEVPVDHLDRAVQDQVVESGFLGHLAARRLGRGLASLEVALGKAPVFVGVPDQEKPRRGPPRRPPEHDAAGAGLAGGAGLAALHLTAIADCGLLTAIADCGLRDSDCRPRRPRPPPAFGRGPTIPKPPL